MKSVVHARGSAVWRHDAHVALSLRSMYRQTTRARRMVSRVSDIMCARSYPPFEQAAASNECENEAIAFGRGRQENGFYISEAAFGGR
eukprot:2708089-Pleurochrysis_carterae.AAC.1